MMEEGRTQGKVMVEGVEAVVTEREIEGKDVAEEEDEVVQEVMQVGQVVELEL